MQRPFVLGEALQQSNLLRGAEQAVPAGERAPALLLLLLWGLAGSLHSPAPSSGADKCHQASCQAQRGSPRCPGQSRGVGLVGFRAGGLLQGGKDAPRRVKLPWSLRSCLERVWNSSKQMLAVGEHSVFCALVVFSLNKSLNPSSGGQAPRCTSLPCVWQEQRAFSKPRFPTVTAVKPGQEMSRDTKLHSFYFFFLHFYFI